MECSSSLYYHLFQHIQITLSNLLSIPMHTFLQGIVFLLVELYYAYTGFWLVYVRETFFLEFSYFSLNPSHMHIYALMYLSSFSYFLLAVKQSYGVLVLTGS